MTLSWGSMADSFQAPLLPLLLLLMSQQADKKAQLFPPLLMAGSWNHTDPWSITWELLPQQHQLTPINPKPVSTPCSLKTFFSLLFLESLTMWGINLSIFPQHMCAISFDIGTKFWASLMRWHLHKILKINKGVIHANICR